ncbi:hypothetical protein DFQ28_003825 [Apophysomyces sp. BC1034]|nr:hypothetical protein DFQ30_003464 [Apophysomyces sp. BC1015]KAG0179103.1 hypothetical protein DFQ29_002518 [Apophysomyces sp. BC1021]KAG0189126.1 hypothetical protein DFQ28_003825 [Apophysomyces sp. BC1034]
MTKLSVRVDTLLDPAGPLLPHDKHGLAFGGTQKKAGFSFFRSRWVRFLALLYVIFSVFLSANHLWNWALANPSLDPRFGDEWVPQRTYDQDKEYSIVDKMTHGLKMSKMFSKSYYQATDGVKPYWLKGSETPSEQDLTIITTVTPATWPELVRLAERWQGPISVTLHATDDDEGTSDLQAIENNYRAQPELSKHVDVHLHRSPQSQVSVLLSRNAARNIARLYAHTEFVCDMPSNMVLATDLRRTMETNKDIFKDLLRAGDVLVVPTFGFPQYDKDRYNVPNQKGKLLELVNEDGMVMLDKHWKANEGPTDLQSWKDATTLYAVEKYEFHYEPVSIESKNIQPWCSEKFLDSRSACRFTSYLSGAELWVLPDDFVVQLPESKEYAISDFDHVIENRLYAKFKWEQCVHHARQLDALGQWKGRQSQHIRAQCSMVIQNWGKGLIGKPE